MQSFLFHFLLVIAEIPAQTTLLLSAPVVNNDVIVLLVHHNLLTVNLVLTAAPFCSGKTEESNTTPRIFGSW